MKTLIIYSSQTGNTEAIAYNIQTGVKDVTGQCDIVKIKDANPKRLYEYDLIGLGAPTYGGTEPANVTIFIHDMWSVGGKHIFVFHSHNTMPLFFFPAIYPKLIHKGLVVIGMHGWYAGTRTRSLGICGDSPATGRHSMSWFRMSSWKRTSVSPGSGARPRC